MRYNLWDNSVRQARYTFNSPAVDRYLFEQITPFVAADVVDWALRIPLRYLVAQRAYKHMIVRSFPEIAGVPWARTCRRIPTSFAADVARQGSGYLWKRLRRTVRRPGPAQLLGSRDYTLTPGGTFFIVFDAEVIESNIPQIPAGLAVKFLFTFDFDPDDPASYGNRQRYVANFVDFTGTGHFFIPFLNEGVLMTNVRARY